ncbi:MAG: hypothetical protein IH935_04270 [Acidobacteria bacterium]|nr:hypothetical protein [Acidobacteriota bacterium]
MGFLVLGLLGWLLPIIPGWAFIIPGLMLTVLTQVFWIRDKKRLREANREGVTRREAPPTGSSAPTQSRRSRSRRRSPRSGRSGRSNRGR